MRKSRRSSNDDEDFTTPTRSFKPITKICTYCDRHRRRESPVSNRKILRKSWLRCGSSTDRDQRRLRDIRSDEIIASSINSRSRKSPSCLKNQGTPREKKKRVNFVNGTTTSISSDDTVSLTRPRDFFDASNSTSYCEPPRRCEAYDRKLPTTGNGDSSSLSSATLKESSSDHWSSGFENQHRHLISSEIDSRLIRLLASRRDPPRRLAGGHDRGDYRSVKSKPINRDSMTTDQPGISSSTQKYRRDPKHRRQGRSEDEDDHLLEDFSGMSLASSSSPRTSKRLPPELQPRILKPRDAMRRAAVKKMLVYPPQGQTGEPLTLFKKWSNIDCHVTGDRVNGFRYTVYYTQKFESRRWMPDPDTGNPFKMSLEDSTTDHG